MTPAMPVTRKIFPDTHPLFLAMAQELRSLVREHRGERPFSIALAGGSTPQRFYEQLVRPPFKEQILWKQVAFYFGDERCVPPDHEDSNYRMAHQALFAHVPEAQVFRMEAESPDLGASAAAYEALLRQHLIRDQDRAPVFDLVLLGIGNDGHTASLFPQTTALQEQEHWVIANEVPQLNTRRMTLTYPVLNAAQRVWILATGIGKRHIIADCLRSHTPQTDAARWPILGVQPSSGNLIWWLDRDAASLLV